MDGHATDSTLMDYSRGPPSLNDCDPQQQIVPELGMVSYINQLQKVV